MARRSDRVLGPYGIDHTVEVSFLGDLTFDQWLQTFKSMDQNPANKRSVRAARR